jgi:IS30 family transposase
MTYTHLDFRQRCQINGYLLAGFNQSQIAKKLGVNKSTISRELSRNQTKFRTKYGYTQYKPNHAQSYAGVAP